MNKKAAILIVLGVEVVIYALIFIALPMLIAALLCDLETLSIPNEQRITMYIAPGLIGALFIALIAIQKREVK